MRTEPVRGREDALGERLRNLIPSAQLVRGWDPQQIRRVNDAARADGEAATIYRLDGDRLIVGPVFPGPEPQHGCAACAEYRMRLAVDHPLLDQLETPLPGRDSDAHTIAVLADVAERAVRDEPLRPGEIIICRLGGLSRHIVRRTINCPARCADSPLSPSSGPSGPVTDRWALREGPDLTREDSPVLKETVDGIVGPVLQLVADMHAPLAMTGALLPDSRAFGYGRALSFGAAAPTAVLEAYERYAGYPHQASILRGATARQLGEDAIDVRSIGWHTDRQLQHPMSRTIPWHQDEVLDWVLGTSLVSGAKVFVPAEIGFYLYEYDSRSYHGARHLRSRPRRRSHFPGSSSGSALGATVREAGMHGLLETIERDQFLMAWFRAAPLPRLVDKRIDDDHECRLMLDTIRSFGLDVHLLVATVDLGLPVVWAMAAHPLGDFPATLSTAGAHPNPIDAVRVALRELVQVVGAPRDWDRERIQPMIQDHWLVATLEDHYQLGAEPEFASRVHAVLDGPEVNLNEAFPGWPHDIWMKRARVGIASGIEVLLDLLADAGLPEMIIVDQTTQDHADIGLAAARALVPGTVPMVFGQAQQILAGIPRLQQWAGFSHDPFDDAFKSAPHPFP